MSVDLPAHLQDITSQDVAAVDDMYERLRNGGKEGVEVVLTLVKGLEGERVPPLARNFNADMNSYRNPPPLRTHWSADYLGRRYGQRS